jgi:hypothetical protein
MLDECPHCFSRVIASSGGECPACRKNIRDTAGTDPARTSMSMLPGAQLPQFCCDCDRATDRYVEVKSTIGGPGGRDWGPIWSILFLPISWALSLVFALESRSQRLNRRSNDLAVVKIPQCESCAAERRPVPIRVDTEELRLTFVVHRDFKKRVGDQ